VVGQQQEKENAPGGKHHPNAGEQKEGDHEERCCGRTRIVDVDVVVVVVVRTSNDGIVASTRTANER